MSNNLYNILKNFNKLTENTVAPDNSATPAEKIYESVEPQGSILSGVAKIESRLAKQFAESDFSKMSSAIQKSGKSKASADAITAAAGREKLGQREMTRRAVAGKKKAVHENMDDEQLDEIGDTPAGKAALGSYIKKAHASGDAARSASSLAPMGSEEETQGRQIVQKRAGGIGQAVDRLTKEGMDEAQGRDEIGAAGVAYQAGYQDGKRAKASGVNPEVNTAAWGEHITDYRRGMHDAFNLPEKGVAEAKEECPDCECTQCECSVNESLSDIDIERQDYNSMSDAEFKRAYKMTKAEWRAQHRDLLKNKVDEDYKHKGRAYGGAAQQDDEDEDEDDKPKSKKVGAPKKKDSDRSSASLPFGGKADTGKHKLPSHKGATTRHSMSDEPPKGTPERAEWEEKHARKEKRAKKIKESNTQLERRFRRIMLSENFKQIMGKHHMNMDEMVKRLSHDIQAYKTHGQMSEVLRDCMEIHSHNPQIADESALGLPGSKNISQMNPGALKPPVTPWEKAKSSVASAFDTKDAWEIPAEPDHELNELARLAGLEIADEGNAFTGKLHTTARGDSFELGGNTYKDTSALDEGTCNECGMYESQCACSEGNAFTGKLHSTARGGKFELAGNTYTDTSTLDENACPKCDCDPCECRPGTTLEDIAKLSGIAVEGRDYGDTKIAEPAKFDNTPEEQYMAVGVLTKGGDGEVAGKEKAMQPNKPTFKNGDNPKSLSPVKEETDPLEALGRNLLRAYNSIKVKK